MSDTRREVPGGFVLAKAAAAVRVLHALRAEAAERICFTRSTVRRLVE